MVLAAPVLARAAESQDLKLLPPHHELVPSFWEQYGLQLGLTLLLVVLAVLGLLLYWQRRRQPHAAEPPDVLAARSLELLRHRPEDPAVLVEISQDLRHYLVAVYQLPPAEFTTTEIGRALQAHPEAPPELAATLLAFLRECDARKFGPVRPSEPMGAAARALDIIRQVEADRRQRRQAAEAQAAVAKVSSAPA